MCSMAVPDLSEVQTPAAFMSALRDYRALRGKPGYRVMAERCRQARTASPIREALIADELPNLKTLRAILDGLKAGPDDQAEFEHAWGQLNAAAVLTGGTPA
jgi:hypothetical protein